MDKQHMNLLTVLGLSALISMSPALAVADEEAAQTPKGLSVGAKAPRFQAQDDAGDLWKSSDHAGKKVLVVYFYPAAMTGGCTKQACSYRDDRDTLSDMGAEVIGVSGDSVEGQALFKRAHALNFTLLADTDGSVAGGFGVPTRKGGAIQRTVDGEEYTLTRGVTPSRWTYVVGLDGRIAYANTKVNAVEDSKDVIAAVRTLLSGEDEKRE